MKLSKEKLKLNLYRNILLLYNTYKVMSLPCNYK